MSKIQINHNLGVSDVKVKIGNMTSVTDVKEDELVDIYLKDGNISARIENITVRQRG